MILDSGERREFTTGAKRDIQTGKGRCDLMPLAEVDSFICDNLILTHIALFMRDKEEMHLGIAIMKFIQTYYTDKYTAVLDLAVHYEEGAVKYGEHNWEKGIPLHCYIDSGIRHLLKFLRGDSDEHHDRAFIWNMLGALWTLHNKPELNDLWEGGETI